jgi:hypothetical protein
VRSSLKPGGTSSALGHGLNAMISLPDLFLRKPVLILIVSIACSSRLCLAQLALVEVDSTPYDRQMAPVQPTLTGLPGYLFDEITLTLVNEWMSELRAMPYRYSREWRTPSEVEEAKTADCKGKAITLYDRMQLNGAANVRFIIGKRRATDLLTHAWVEWQTGTAIYILDPTFNWTATAKGQDRSKYVPFYAYEGPHKYLAADWVLVRRNLSIRSPIAPSQGAITRPIRSSWKFRGDQTAPGEFPIDPRLLANRSAL